MRSSDYLDIHPQWVLVNNELHSVSDFADIAPHKRPDAICPACNNPVTLKLGQIKVHHYAHRHNDICVLNHPETILHYNTKFHFYRQLKDAQEIYTLEPCSGDCGKTERRVWLNEWDRVEVEYVSNSIRPDIALLLQGKVAAAIEILVTHAVDQNKAKILANDAIRWAEIKAHTSLYEGDSRWTNDQPLPYRIMVPKVESWTCNECVQREKREYERIRREQERPQDRIFYGKIVDFYYRSGKKYREVFYIKCKVKPPNQVIQAWVEKENFVKFFDAPKVKNWLEILQQAVQKEVDIKREKGHALVDDSMGWREWRQGNKFYPKDIDRFPFKLLWDEKVQKWYHEE